MKNFPHQFNDLAKLTAALGVADVVIGAGHAVTDERVFGEALATANVYAFRNKALTVAQNIIEAKKKPIESQGFRAAARDIRRFLYLANLVSSDNGTEELTQRGRDILDAVGNVPLRNALWRDAMLQLRLGDGANRSHPYRILVRLVADRPGIATAKLLLALEAEDDSDAEYARMLALADLSLVQIVANLGISEASARNAVKILPAIAEQVGDISRNGSFTFLRKHSITTEDSTIEQPPPEYEKTNPPPLVSVDHNTISPLPNFGAAAPAEVDLSAGIEIRKRRTIEHHAALVNIAKILGDDGYSLFARPYDCLAFKGGLGGLLLEMKTLDGTRTDERSQSEKALGQLRGYNYFNVPDDKKVPKLVEVAAYPQKPSDDAIHFMRVNSVLSAWLETGTWRAADLDGNIENFSADNLLAD